MTIAKHALAIGAVVLTVATAAAAGPEFRKLEYIYAEDWYKAITSDTFG